MIRTRQELEEQERVLLAPWAQKSADSAGRTHPERRHPHRTEYQRDRARIIHSRAFRRLEYKTQVFLNGTGDHLRTRLTHTFEVANITRTIARALALNEDLAEAIALAHDLGHPPFGHSGEETLNALMRDHGGFDHNAQSLRIVDVIESRYPKFAGLNLSDEVREGLQKHARFYRKAGEDKAHPRPSLEAQLANLADEITYYSHDLDDGLDFQLLEPEQLAQLTVWRESEEDVKRHFPRLKGASLQGYVIRCMIDRQVADVIRTSAARIERSGVAAVDDVRAHRDALVAYSKTLLRGNQQLRRFLYKNLYYHPRVAGANDRACEMLRDVFSAYLRDPKLLGRATARRIKKDGLHRTVCDYISGMTDRYLIEEHGRLFTPRVRINL
jgi:dGTPase